MFIWFQWCATISSLVINWFHCRISSSPESTYYVFLKISLSISKEASIGWRGLLQNLSCCKIKWRVRTLTFVFPSSLSFLLYSSSFLYLPALCEKIPSCPILEVNETSVEFNSIPLMSLLNVNHENVGEYTIYNIEYTTVGQLCHNVFFILIYAQVLSGLTKMTLAWSDFH